jgi:hypothetical protein
LLAAISHHGEYGEQAETRSDTQFDVGKYGRQTEKNDVEDVKVEYKIAVLIESPIHEMYEYEYHNAIENDLNQILKKRCRVKLSQVQIFSI